MCIKSVFASKFRLFAPLLALCFAIGFGILALSFSPACAQSKATSEAQPAPVLPDPLTPEAIRNYLSTLSDREVRALMLNTLDATAKQTEAKKQPAADESRFAFAKKTLDAFLSATARPFLLLPEMAVLINTSITNFHGKLGTSGILGMFGILALAIIIGYAAELAINRLAAKIVGSRIKLEDSSTLWTTLRFLFLRLCNAILGLVVFLVIVQWISRYAMSAEQYGYAHPLIIFVILVPRIARAFLVFVYAPNKPDFRLLNVNDWAARFFTTHQTGFVLLLGLANYIYFFNSLNDIPSTQNRFGAWFMIAAHIYLGYMIWRGWDQFIAMARGNNEDELTKAEEFSARAYPWFLMFLNIATFVVLQILLGFDQRELAASGVAYYTMMILSMWPLADTAIRGLVRHVVPPMKGEGDVAVNAYLSTMRSYIRIGRLITFGLVMYWVSLLWSLDFTNVAADSMGEKIASSAIKALIILAIGYLVWEVITLAINRRLASENTGGADEGGDEHDEGGGMGGSRLSTVLPMIRLTLQTAIVILTTLLALSNIGIDTTPLLAGAGILGLAVGFGAQSLVRDVVSGIFFLIDDAFRIGEYIEVSETVGTVEKISVRSLRLRHQNGPVHTIPYGEIPKVTNNSRDWVIMKLKFTFPFETDVEQVRKIFKKVGQEMLGASYAGDLLQTFKSQGVYGMDDVGIIIRGKFMAKPGTQWVMRKDIYARVQKAIDAAGIHYARKEVRVQIPGLENTHLTEDQARTIAAAAADAAQKTTEGNDGKHK